MATVTGVEIAESENGDAEYDDEDFEETGSKYSESQETNDEIQLKANRKFSEYDEDFEGSENSILENEEPEPPLSDSNTLADAPNSVITR